MSNKLPREKIVDIIQTNKRNNKTNVHDTENRPKRQPSCATGTIYWAATVTSVSTCAHRC